MPPIYEYRCRLCGKVTEHMHGIDENPMLHCFECTIALDRLISAGSFRIDTGNPDSKSRPGGQKK